MTSDGLRIVEAKFDSTRLIPLERITDNSIKLYSTLVQQEKSKYSGQRSFAQDL